MTEGFQRKPVQEIGKSPERAATLEAVVEKTKELYSDLKSFVAQRESLSIELKYAKLTELAALLAQVPPTPESEYSSDVESLGSELSSIKITDAANEKKVIALKLQEHLQNILDLLKFTIRDGALNRLVDATEGLYESGGPLTGMDAALHQLFQENKHMSDRIKRLAHKIRENLGDDQDHDLTRSDHREAIAARTTLLKEYEAKLLARAERLQDKSIAALVKVAIQRWSKNPDDTQKIDELEMVVKERLFYAQQVFLVRKKVDNFAFSLVLPSKVSELLESLDTILASESAPEADETAT